MSPWLILGAGGKGVGNMVVKLAVTDKRPVIAIVRNSQSAEMLEDQGIQVFRGDACDKPPSFRQLAKQLAPQQRLFLRWGEHRII